MPVHSLVHPRFRDWSDEHTPAVAMGRQTTVFRAMAPQPRSVASMHTHHRVAVTVAMLPRGVLVHVTRFLDPVTVVSVLPLVSKRFRWAAVERARELRRELVDSAVSSQSETLEQERRAVLALLDEHEREVAEDEAQMEQREAERRREADARAARERETELRERASRELEERAERELQERTERRVRARAERMQLQERGA